MTEFYKNITEYEKGVGVKLMLVLNIALLFKIISHNILFSGDGKITSILILRMLFQFFTGFYLYKANK